jgi:hypothetical protein
MHGKTGTATTLARQQPHIRQQGAQQRLPVDQNNVKHMQEQPAKMCWHNTGQ